MTINNNTLVDSTCTWSTVSISLSRTTRSAHILLLMQSPLLGYFFRVPRCLHVHRCQLGSHVAESDAAVTYRTN